MMNIFNLRAEVRKRADICMAGILRQEASNQEILPFVVQVVGILKAAGCGVNVGCSGVERVNIGIDARALVSQHKNIAAHFVGLFPVGYSVVCSLPLQGFRVLEDLPVNAERSAYWVDVVFSYVDEEWE